MNPIEYIEAPAFPLMDESPRTDRNLGWLYHLPDCKAYNETVIRFPNYDCVCHREAWLIGHLILGFLLKRQLTGK